MMALLFQKASETVCKKAEHKCSRICNSACTFVMKSGFCCSDIDEQARELIKHETGVAVVLGVTAVVFTIILGTYLILYISHKIKLFHGEHDHRIIPMGVIHSYAPQPMPDSIPTPGSINRSRSSYKDNVSPHQYIHKIIPAGGRHQ